MEQNTYSLLNAHWMITSSGATSMMPQLLSIIKGNKLEKAETVIPVVHMEMDDDSYFDVPEMNSNSQYINVLSIKSPLYKYDQICGPAGTRTMTRLLKEWEANDNVVGVVIDIDCPGGQVSGLAEFADYLHNYSKPLVSYTDGLMASAAYYISAACDYIVVNPNADLIGSIGTMLTYVDLSGILIKEGGIVKDVYASKSTRKNEESRDMEKGSEALLIKNILDPARDKFVSDVNSFRQGINETVFDGAVYSPSESIDLKLVDELGTLQTAFDKVVSLSKKKTNNKLTPNNNMNAKNLPLLQAVLGLDAPLASTEDKGSYLNDDQLDMVENRLVELESTNTQLQTNLDAALPNNEVKDQLTASQGTVTAIEASIDSMLTSAGLDVTGTLTEKTAALGAKVTEMGAKDGAKPTAVKVDVNNAGATSNVVGGIDVSAAMNN